MSLRPYKFQIVAIVQQVEDDNVVAEVTSAPATVFGVENLAEWANMFTVQLEAMERESI